MLSPNCQIAHAEREAGSYYPRMFRDHYHNGTSVPLTDSEEASFATSADQAHILEADLARVARVITPSAETAGAYGAEIRNLLILACTEVEAQWKGVLRTHGYERDRYTTKDYVRLLRALRLDEYSLRLVRYRKYGEQTPFREWKCEQPTISLPWYDAYNAVKHDREESAQQATLAHAISAVAAVWVLLAAQYGPRYLQQAEGRFFGVATWPDWPAQERTYPPRLPQDWRSLTFQF